MCSRISVRGGSGAALAMTARPARPQRGLLNATLREPSCAKHAPGEAWRTRRAPRAATHRWLTEGCRMTRVMRGRFGVSTGGSALCEKASCPTLDNLVGKVSSSLLQYLSPKRYNRTKRQNKSAWVEVQAANGTPNGCHRWQRKDRPAALCCCWCSRWPRRRRRQSSLHGTRRLKTGSLTQRFRPHYRCARATTLNTAR